MLGVGSHVGSRDREPLAGKPRMGRRQLVQRVGRDKDEGIRVGLRQHLLRGTFVKRKRQESYSEARRGTFSVRPNSVDSGFHGQEGGCEDF